MSSSDDPRKVSLLNTPTQYARFCMEQLTAVTRPPSRYVSERDRTRSRVSQVDESPSDTSQWDRSSQPLDILDPPPGDPEAPPSGAQPPPESQLPRGSQLAPWPQSLAGPEGLGGATSDLSRGDLHRPPPPGPPPPCASPGAARQPPAVADQPRPRGVRLSTPTGPPPGGGDPASEPLSRAGAGHPPRRRRRTGPVGRPRLSARLGAGPGPRGQHHRSALST